MLPPPVETMCGQTSEHILKTPFKFTSNMYDQSSKVSFGKFPGPATPALLNKTSIFPKTSRALSTDRLMSSCLDTSHFMNSAVPPRLLTLSLTSIPCPSLLAIITTLAPSRA